MVAPPTDQRTGCEKAPHLVGDYGQLHYRMLYGAPNFNPRGVYVEVQKL